MTGPIVPATLSFAPDGTPFAPGYDDVYHAAAGALAQARHVFLGGNGLPRRWAGRHRFTVLETGFGLGNNFLATWAAWREDPRRCDRLVFVSIEKHPLRPEDLRRVHRDSPLPDLAAALEAQWPPATPDLHRLEFEDGRVQLLLALGDVADVLPQLQVTPDAIYLDGFAPARNAAMWDAAVFQRIARLAAPGATAATWSAARAVRDGLSAAGFRVEAASGFAHKRDMTVATHEPRHPVPLPAAFLPSRPPGEALVVGAGLAGSAAVHALLQQGWSCVVVDAQPRRAAAHGPAGLFHGTFNAPDGPHAQWHRAAALQAARRIGATRREGQVPGACDGLLRLEARLDDAAAQAQLDRVGLPRDYVQWLDREAACARVGLDLPSGGWWFGHGGWVEPSRLVEHLLRHDPARVRRVAAEVQRLERRGTEWMVLDAHGREQARAPVVVLAGGAGMPELLASSAEPPLPLVLARGQTTRLPAALAGLRAPHHPVAGQGYAITLQDGSVLVGATTHEGDPEPALRAADQQHNLVQARALGCLTSGGSSGSDGLGRSGDPGAPGGRPATFDGHVGWRATTPDRLPVIGPLPDLAAWQALREAGRRADAPRHLPRRHDDSGGLYVLTGFGSRGLTHASLAAQTLAAWITGGPFPVPAALRDATDAARFALRATLRSG